MKKILYVILHTCTRPERYDGIVNSWGKDVDYLFYADCDDETKKIVKVSDDSTYSSNEPKHINVIKYFTNDYQYEWFFFCDDDTFVNTKNLEQNIDNFDKNKINGSILKGTWEKDRTLEYCSGGAGYLINKELLLNISKSIKNCNSGYSDVSLGVCPKEIGIEFCDYEKFNSQKPEYYKRDIHTIKDMFTYHYVNSDIMVEMYQIIN